jgi:DNA-binding NarL/FixJ family response regulator
MKILLSACCENEGSAFKNILKNFGEIDELLLAQTIEQFIDAFTEERVDLALLSAEPLRYLRADDDALVAVNARRPKSIVLTREVTGMTVMEAIDCGINDVIALSSSVEEMFLRMKMVVDGVTDLSQKSYLEGMRLLLDSNSKTHNANDEIDLQILMYVARGYSNKDIAEAVYLSLQTVRNRISRMMQAMQAENRTQLALMFLQP